MNVHASVLGCVKHIIYCYRERKQSSIDYASLQAITLTVKFNAGGWES